MPQSQFNETRLWICQRTQVAQAKLGPVEDDLGLLTAVTNKDLLEAADFGSRRFLKRLVTMPIGIQKSFRGNFVH
jgi:hypothetical protein